MAKGGKKRVPSSASVDDVRGSKQPRTTEGVDFRGLTPVWRVGRLEMVDPFGWHVLDARGVEDVRLRLKDFESMTWMEILVGGRKQHHPIQVDRLCKAARDRLAELELDQIEELVSLRVNARARIFGIRDANVLDVLWWDPDHAICPSKGADN